MKPSTAVTAVAVLLAFGAIGYASVLRHRVYQEHLAGLNAAALADSTQHDLLTDLSIARRQVQQMAVQLDRRTHERDEAGRALADLSIKFRSLTGNTVGTASSVTPGLVRLEGSYDAWDSAGVRVAATVDVAIVSSVRPAVAKDSQVLWAWTVDRRPLDLAVDFSCRRDTALVHVTGPPWASVDVLRAVQDPTACNPPPRGLFSWTVPSLPVLGIVAGIAAAVGWFLHP